MAQSEFRKNIKNLFFVKRRPQTHVPVEWKRPATQEEYDELVEYEGLISIAKNEPVKKYPTLKQDLLDLEQHLLPAFWEFNQKAKHYQNRFYLYQWIFMLGALITTMLAAFTTYTYAVLPESDNIFPQLFGYITAIISGITAYFNVMSNQGAPQQRWAKTRRLSEELRMMYFKYLAHLEPFHTNDRVQRMREMVLAVRRKENSNA